MNRPWILLNQAGDPAGGGAPAAPPPPPPAPPPPAAPPAGDPAWLPERLARAAEQERTRVLTELGITDAAKAKKLLDDAAKAEDEKKSQGEKLGETSKALEAERAEKVRLAEVVKDHATRQITVLTTEQQAAIRAIAPDTDPAAQLRAIDALRPTWAAAAPAGAPPAPGTPSAPGAPPTPPGPPAGGTAPPPTAPPPTGGGSPPNRKAEYEALKAKNPHAAGLFLNTYAAEIYGHA